MTAINPKVLEQNSPAWRFAFKDGQFVGTRLPTFPQGTIPAPA